MASAGKTEETDRQKHIDQLLVDVFRSTGQKITADDPIVVAALFQASLIKSASREAANALGAASQEAAQNQAQHTANLETAIQGAFQKLTEGAKKVTDAELASASSRFVLASTATLEAIREQAVKSTPGYLSKRVVLVGLAAFVFGASLGAVGTMFAKPTMTSEQLRLMHNGLLLDAAWPKLNKAARDVVQPPGQLGGQQPPVSVN